MNDKISVWRYNVKYDVWCYEFLSDFKIIDCCLFDLNIKGCDNK